MGSGWVPWVSEVVTWLEHRRTAAGMLGAESVVTKRSSCWLSDQVFPLDSVSSKVKGEEQGQWRQSLRHKHGWWSGGWAPRLGQSLGSSSSCRTHCMTLGKSLSPAFLICKTEMIRGLCMRAEGDSIPGVTFKILTAAKAWAVMQ